MEEGREERGLSQRPHPFSLSLGGPSPPLFPLLPFALGGFGFVLFCFVLFCFVLFCFVFWPSSDPPAPLEDPYWKLRANVGGKM